MVYPSFSNMFFLTGISLYLDTKSMKRFLLHDTLTFQQTQYVKLVAFFSTNLTYCPLAEPNVR